MSHQERGIKKQKKSKREYPESIIQRRFIKYLEKNWAQTFWWNHSPSNVIIPKVMRGLTRKQGLMQKLELIKQAKIIGLRNKKMGTRAGTPDVEVKGPGGRCRAFEFKSPTGVLSDVQKETIQHLERHGHTVKVIRSYEDGVYEFEKWAHECGIRIIDDGTTMHYGNCQRPKGDHPNGFTRDYDRMFYQPKDTPPIDDLSSIDEESESSEDEKPKFTKPFPIFKSKKDDSDVEEVVDDFVKKLEKTRDELTKRIEDGKKGLNTEELEFVNDYEKSKKEEVEALKKTIGIMNPNTKGDDKIEKMMKAAILLKEEMDNCYTQHSIAGKRIGRVTIPTFKTRVDDKVLQHEKVLIKEYHTTIPNPNKFRAKTKPTK